MNTSEQELAVGISTVCDHLTMTLACRDFVIRPSIAEKMAARAVDFLGQAAGW